MRLKRVDVRYDGAVLRRYELAYESALSSADRSRLASIRECGAGGGDCLAPTAFTWQDGISGFTSADTVSIPVPAGYVAPGRFGWTYSDINGDGRLDLVWAGGADINASTVRYRLGTGNGVSRYDGKSMTNFTTKDGLVDNPVFAPTENKWAHVARGGHFKDNPPELRSAARRKSEKKWMSADPQEPQSIWWLTNYPQIGFRIVRPLEPDELTRLTSKVVKENDEEFKP